MIKKLGLTLAAMSLCATSAFAGVIVDTVDAFDLSGYDFKSFGFSESVLRSHDLSDQGFVPGGTEIITGGSLAIEISDYVLNGDFIDAFQVASVPEPEIAFFQLESFDPFAGDIIGAENVIGSVTLEGSVATAVAALNVDGMLDVYVYGLGDFYVGTSTLTLDTVSASVTEPGILILLGLGLVGLRIARPKSS